MNNMSSGCYIIDADYNVIGLNETARSIYPQITIGEKCYKVLMGLDEPCGPCPVKNGVKGPRTYVDPIRGITESVDAVEEELPGYGKCYALVFSTVGTIAEYATTLPTSADELINLAMIEALTLNYTDVFAVNLKSGKANIFRRRGKSVKESQFSSYQEILEDKIVANVVEEDREVVRKKTNLNYYKQCLKERKTERITVRCQIHGELHYFRFTAVRIGEPDTFENIVIGIACIDEEIKSNQEREELENTLSILEKDRITGLYTYSAFLVRAEEARKNYPESDMDFTLMKVRNLELIIQQYGQKAADQLLAFIGSIFRPLNNDQTCISYMGNGIFAGFADKSFREDRARRIRRVNDSVKEQFNFNHLQLKWAVYDMPSRKVSIDDILEQTYYLLNTVSFKNDENFVEFDRSVIDQLAWENHVNETFSTALSKGEFLAWYQPKYDIETGQIIGAEALVRWQKPDGEIISPGRFVPILEKNGQIQQLDQYMFQTVCAMEKKMQEKGYKNIPISVNLSRASMLNNELAESYSKIAQSYQISCSQIPLEITESTTIMSREIQGCVHRLREKGFLFHMDDFGSGFSSLASLGTIPFETIKLDKALIDMIGENNVNMLIKHTIAYIKESGKKVVAEGVENMEQYIHLKALGCGAIQGYYFSKPLAEDMFLELLA